MRWLLEVFRKPIGIKDTVLLPDEDPIMTPVLQSILHSTSKSRHSKVDHWIQPGTHYYHFSLSLVKRVKMWPMAMA